MVRFPRKVNVAGVSYTVDRENLQQDDGICYDHTQAILIGKHLGPDLERETVLHELLHAVFFVSGAGSHLSDQTIERIVRTLSPVLLDTLRRNPTLRHYLFTGLSENFTM